MTTSAPAQTGETLAIYCTGLSALQSALKSGELPPNPPPQALNTPQVSIGGITAPVVFAGAAAGLAGLYQVTVQVPPGIQTGTAAAVILTSGSVSSNTVTVAVQ